MTSRITKPNTQALLPSPAMRRIYRQISRLAPSSAPICLRGPSGAGKEHLAQLIHQQSGRTGPFIALNAATLTGNLVASELFGHVRGAFTGAYTPHEGAFRSAQGGTLFLDEIAELPLTSQAMILRALEEDLVRPVGGQKSHPIDVRIVSATHADLEALIGSGSFRKDLWFRLNVLQLEIPPLRERPTDISHLAQRMLAEVAPERSFTQESIETLQQHAWPGNIRELKNVITRTLILHDHSTIHPCHLLFSGFPSRKRARVSATQIRSTYESLGGDALRTARHFGIHRTTVYRAVKRHNDPAQA